MMRAMSSPISVVCSDASENCLGRAIVLAEVFADLAPVRIVSPQLGKAIWRPAQSSKIELRTLRVTSKLDYPRAVAWLGRELDGSRVVVSKPRETSLGLTLAAGVTEQQLLLDIDDWELGFMRHPERSLAKRARRAWSRSVDLVAPRAMNSYWTTRWLDDWSSRAPRRLVSNHWLRRKFGGVVLPHVRDTERLDPERFKEAGQAKRRELQLGSRRFVAFIGTIREHKGVEDLVAAVARSSGPDAPGLLLAGVDFDHAFSRAVLETARSLLSEDRLRLVGTFDSSELPVLVAAADVICIPSRDIPGAWGQIPAKLFDAMSMAKPIVSSSVNDMSEILSGCGLVFPGGDVGALADQLAKLLVDEQLSTRLGQAARLRAIEGYSIMSGRRAVAPSLADLPTFQKS